MSDLIDRQAAIEALFELYEYQRDIDPTEAADLVRQGIYLSEKKIERLPSAEPKKGKWEHTITYYPYCSICGWMPEEDEMTHGAYDFCPNCGADMRGERDEG